MNSEPRLEYAGTRAGSPRGALGRLHPFLKEGAIKTQYRINTEKMNKYRKDIDKI